MKLLAIATGTSFQELGHKLSQIYLVKINKIENK